MKHNDVTEQATYIYQKWCYVGIFVVVTKPQSAQRCSEYALMVHEIDAQNHACPVKREGVGLELKWAWEKLSGKNQAESRCEER